MDVGLKTDCHSVSPDEGYVLTAKQYKAIELLIEGEKTKKEIAEEVGVTRQTIHRWMDDDRFKAELQELASDKKRQTMNFINSKALIAAKKLWELTDSKDTRTKCAVLKDWLDRAIGKPTSKVEVNAENITSEDEDYDIEQALERLNNNVVPIRPIAS